MQQVAGVVIDPVQDFDFVPVGQGGFGEVRLPGFVGLGCFEAVQAAFGSFLGLRGDRAVGVQDPADGGVRGHGGARGAQVVLDGQRAGVQPGGGEFGAQVQDQLHHGRVGGAGIGVRFAALGLQGLVSAGVVGCEQLVDALPGDLVDPGGIRDAQRGVADLVDDDVVFGHVSVSRMSRLMVLVWSVNDVPTQE